METQDGHAMASVELPAQQVLSELMARGVSDVVVAVVGITSELVQRLPFAASAECGPVGRFTVMLST